jgi:hypothetical protein
LCAVVPSVLISMIAIDSSRQALEKAVKTELSDLAQGQEEKLLSLLQRAETDLGTWSGLHTKQNVLTDDEDGAIGHELINLRKRYPIFGELFVVNPSGTIVAAARASNKGKVVSRQNYFVQELSGSDFRGAVQRQNLIDGTGLVTAAPIRADYDRDTVVGVLAGIVDWSMVRSTLNSVAGPTGSSSRKWMPKCRQGGRSNPTCGEVFRTANSRFSTSRSSISALTRL